MSSAIAMEIPQPFIYNCEFIFSWSLTKLASTKSERHKHSSNHRCACWEFSINRNIYEITRVVGYSALSSAPSYGEIACVYNCRLHANLCQRELILKHKYVSNSVSHGAWNYWNPHERCLKRDTNFLLHTDVLEQETFDPGAGEFGIQYCSEIVFLLYFTLVIWTVLNSLKGFINRSPFTGIAAMSIHSIVLGLRIGVQYVLVTRVNAKHVYVCMPGSHEVNLKGMDKITWYNNKKKT